MLHVSTSIFVLLLCFTTKVKQVLAERVKILAFFFILVSVSTKLNMEIHLKLANLAKTNIQNTGGVTIVAHCVY